MRLNWSCGETTFGGTKAAVVSEELFRQNASRLSSTVPPLDHV